ncbi:thiol-disulfide oxidoreductase DCC family protein [Marinilabilia rubra]|uniref:DUF393 domain-containing protein n=1 Tax=Marinilabilia rubra TaxID=2162893 RepID=A0A2U2BA81_9BACT|nr:DCC1-like thiol-disulfide oxidoreductase family protein [Marinilabilia rubra]PWD99967.1 DUF393 domain-containing protein [Marinilabilia rubra]
MIVLFDGFCVLCSGFAQWLHKKFGDSVRLIAMQSNDGRELLHKHGISPQKLDEVVVLQGHEVINGAPAILFIMQQTGWFGRVFSSVFKLFPSSWIKWGYRVVANNRYKWFGRKNTCTIIQD